MNNLFKCGEYNINMTIQHGFTFGTKRDITLRRKRT
jgi:hypothetical protein